MKRFSHGRKVATRGHAQFLWFSDRREEALDLDRDAVIWLEISESSARRAWVRNRESVLKEWRECSPGTRPSAWWKFDAPEPRRQLSGAGRPGWEAVPAMVPAYGFGVPLDWAGFLKTDPPEFESQATYLKRHGLLTADEELRADFKPEVINDFSKLAESVGEVAV